VDFLLVVSEPTPVGLLTARRILGLSERLPIAVRSRRVLWNKVGAAGVPEAAGDLPTLATVPQDTAVLATAERGGTVFDLPEDNPAYAAVGGALASLLGAGPLSGHQE
jgi:MinD superfamily P-loop ATPase